VKILIVDDDDSLRSVLAREVEARGFEAVQSHFGDGGVHLYEKSGPWEFVLSDYRFTGTDDQGWNAIASRDPPDQSLSANGSDDLRSERCPQETAAVLAAHPSTAETISDLSKF